MILYVLVGSDGVCDRRLPVPRARGDGAAAFGRSQAPSTANTEPTRYGHPTPTGFLCDEHAMGGMDMTLLIEPNGKGSNSVRVIGGNADRSS
jgi:hypothetical protein